jgi:hypothetical protein
MVRCGEGPSALTCNVIVVVSLLLGFPLCQVPG